MGKHKAITLPQWFLNLEAKAMSIRDDAPPAVKKAANQILFHLMVMQVHEDQSTVLRSAVEIGRWLEWAKWKPWGERGQAATAIRIALTLTEAARKLGYVKNRRQNDAGRKQVEREIASGALTAHRVRPGGKKWWFYNRQLLEK